MRTHWQRLSSVAGPPAFVKGSGLSRVRLRDLAAGGYVWLRLATLRVRGYPGYSHGPLTCSDCESFYGVAKLLMVAHIEHNKVKQTTQRRNSLVCYWWKYQVARPVAEETYPTGCRRASLQPPPYLEIHHGPSNSRLESTGWLSLSSSSTLQVERTCMRSLIAVQLDAASAAPTWTVCKTYAPHSTYSKAG